MLIGATYLNCIGIVVTINNEEHQTGGGIFPFHSGMNHSCNPNASIICVGERASIRCEAIRDIKIGEEIVFSYLDITDNTHINKLYQMWSIECDCQKINI